MAGHPPPRSVSHSSSGSVVDHQCTSRLCCWLAAITTTSYRQLTDKSFKKNKAGIIALSYHERPGIDYSESSSSVMRHESLHTLLALPSKSEEHRLAHVERIGQLQELYSVGGTCWECDRRMVSIVNNEQCTPVPPFAIAFRPDRGDQSISESNWIQTRH